MKEFIAAVALLMLIGIWNLIHMFHRIAEMFLQKETKKEAADA